MVRYNPLYYCIMDSIHNLWWTYFRRLQQVSCWEMCIVLLRENQRHSFHMYQSYGFSRLSS